MNPLLKNLQIHIKKKEIDYDAETDFILQKKMSIQ